MQRHIFILLLSLLCIAPALAANPQVEFQTNQGSFVVELYPEKAPKTVVNFLEYVHNNFYPGTIFHRTINRFMIQGGGFTTELKDKTSSSSNIGDRIAGDSNDNLLLPPIPNESNNGLKNERGTLAMARSFEPDSATSQFFINLNDNKFLNFYKSDPHYIGYCVFGKVIRGMEVADRIGELPTKVVGKQDHVPLQPVFIEKVALLENPVDASPPESIKQPKSSKSVIKGKKRG